MDFGKNQTLASSKIFIFKRTTQGLKKLHRASLIRFSDTKLLRFLFGRSLFLRKLKCVWRRFPVFTLQLRCVTNSLDAPFVVLCQIEQDLNWLMHDWLLFISGEGWKSEYLLCMLMIFFFSLPRLTGMRQLNTSRWDSVRISKSLWTVTSTVTASGLLAANCSCSVCWNTTFWSNKSPENWACVEFGERRTSYHSSASGTSTSGKTYM